MDSSAQQRWLGIKPYVFRLFSGFLFLWCINQVVYVVTASVVPMPGTTANDLILVFPHRETQHTVLLVFHSIGILVFGIGTFTPSRALMRMEEWWEVHRERPTWIAGVFVYVGFALAILIYFWVSITDPRYHTYIDPGEENIVVRNTHLIRPGVTHQTIPFAEIREIQFGFDPSLSGQDSYINLVLQDGREVEVGRFTLDYSEEALVELGKAISQHSSVPFEEPDIPLFPLSYHLPVENDRAVAG